MEHGLKLKPSKCNFFRTEISYLGHKVSAAGMEPNTEGLKGIAEITPPATYTEVHKLFKGLFRCLVYSEYVEGSRSSHMLRCVHVGKCLLTSCERVIQKKTLNPFILTKSSWMLYYNK